MKKLAPVLFLLIALPTFAQQRETPFQRIFNEPDIGKKRDIYRPLSKPEKVEVRRLNFQWGSESLELDAGQLAYLSRLSDKLPTITMNEAKDFENEALELFTLAEGHLLFGSIGPYAPCDVFVKASMQPTTCRCSIESKYNVSCSGPCFTTTLCTTTLEGCGFAWLYPCAGWCGYE
jgi:hypothetical protein